MTDGISPKVLNPVLAQLLAAIVAQVQELVAGGDYSLTAIVLACTTVVTLVLGYRADPGEVVVNVGPASDKLLPELATNGGD